MNWRQMGVERTLLSINKGEFGHRGVFIGLMPRRAVTMIFNSFSNFRLTKILRINYASAHANETVYIDGLQRRLRDPT